MQPKFQEVTQPDFTTVRAWLAAAGHLPHLPWPKPTHGDKPPPLPRLITRPPLSTSEETAARPLRHDPEALLACFPSLSLRYGFRLVGATLSGVADGQCIIWAMPAGAAPPLKDWTPQPSPYFAQPVPGPVGANGCFMHAISGDGTPAMYLSASLFERWAQFGLGNRFGNTHNWLDHDVLAGPLTWPTSGPLPQGEAEVRDTVIKAAELAGAWRLTEGQDLPGNWSPTVHLSASTACVTFYTYAKRPERAVYRHVDLYVDGGLAFTTQVAPILQGGPGITVGRLGWR